MSPRRPLRSTVPSLKPARRVKTPLPAKTRRPRPPKGGLHPLPPKFTPRPKLASHSTVARIIDQSETSLVDLIDNLLNRGVLLNADLVLGLADVDLVYVRLSALLCAADRVLPPRVTKLRLKPPRDGPQSRDGEASLLGGRSAAAAKTASNAE